MNKAFETALNAAFEIYASTLGVSKDEAIGLYKSSETTRDCIMLLVLAQADKSKLRQLAASL